MQSAQKSKTFHDMATPSLLRLVLLYLLFLLLLLMLFMLLTPLLLFSRLLILALRLLLASQLSCRPTFTLIGVIILLLSLKVFILALVVVRLSY